LATSFFICDEQQFSRSRLKTQPDLSDIAKPLLDRGFYWLNKTGCDR